MSRDAIRRKNARIRKMKKASTAAKRLTKHEARFFRLREYGISKAAGDVLARRPDKISSKSQVFLAGLVKNKLVELTEAQMKYLSNLFYELGLALGERDGKMYVIDRSKGNREIKRDRKVYVIRAGMSGHLKIGIAINPEKRLRNLQVANHEILKLSLVVDVYQRGRTALTVEQKLHKKFKAHHVNGEWYQGISDEEIEAAMPEGAEILYKAL